MGDPRDQAPKEAKGEETSLALRDNFPSPSFVPALTGPHHPTALLPACFAGPRREEHHHEVHICRDSQSPSTQLIERDLSSPTLGGARPACRRLRGAVTSRALPSSSPPLPPRNLGTGWKEGRWRRPHHHLSNVCGEHGDFPCPRAPPFTCSTRHPSAPGVRVCAAFV